MARRFRVSIGGITYLVEVEEEVQPLNGVAPKRVTAPSPVGARPAMAPPPATAALAPALASNEPRARAVPPSGDTPADGAEVVRAPLPGTIVAVRCEVGRAVQSGEVIAVLEAMKMENEITAPRDGTVQAVLVEKGATVGLGDALVVIG